MNNMNIKKDTGCMDDYDPNSLPPDVAQMKIARSLEVIPGVEKLALRSSLNRTLAADIRANINVPSGTNSAMDGYAVISSDIPAQGTADLQVIGNCRAGVPFTDTVKSGDCVRIMTGGILPAGTDTVIVQERVARKGDVITIDNTTRTGDNVRRAGEDIAPGDIVLNEGHCITPADLGLLASLGIGEVKVHRRLRVAFFSTGDELRSIGEALDAGCVYDSNRYTLHGMLRRLNVDAIDMGVIADERELVEQALLEASEIADVIITSGGVSVGEADYVKEAVNKIGAVEFWKIAMKPGRPLAFGRVKDAWFFGLPGNPVSVMVTFYLFVQQALRSLMGQRKTESFTIKMPCVSRLKKRPGRIEYQRGIMQRDENGNWQVQKTGAQGSGILRSMSQANCFIILPMESEGVQPGMAVEVQPFFSIM